MGELNVKVYARLHGIAMAQAAKARELLASGEIDDEVLLQLQDTCLGGLRHRMVVVADDDEF